MNTKLAFLTSLLLAPINNFPIPPATELVKIVVPYCLFTCYHCNNLLYTSNKESFSNDYYHHTNTQCEFISQLKAVDNKQKDRIAVDDLIFTATVSYLDETSFMAYCKPCNQSYKATTKDQLLETFSAHLQSNCPTVQKCIAKKARHFSITEKPQAIVKKSENMHSKIAVHKNQVQASSQETINLNFLDEYYDAYSDDTDLHIQLNNALWS